MTKTNELPEEKAARIEAYEAKRAAKVERLRQAAERARSDAEAHHRTADRMADVIPFGQPILVGHYSEKSDRRYRERIHNHMYKWVEKTAEANELDRRAEAAEKNRTIFSDDPAAVDKLEDKLERLQQRQELMKAANKCVRKNDREGLLDLGFTETQATKLFEPDFCGRVGFPDYMLKNNNANIRRIKQRVQHLEAHANDETSEYSIGPVRVVDNVEDNRLQVFFPGKPSGSCRSELKSHGFRWSRYNGCWQRQRSANADWAAKYVVEKFYGAGDDD